LAKKGAAAALQLLDDGYDDTIVSHNAVPVLVELARSNPECHDHALDTLERLLPFMELEEPDSISDALHMFHDLLSDITISYRLRSCAAFSLGNMLSSMRASGTPCPTNFPTVDCITSSVVVLESHHLHEEDVISPWLWLLFNIDFEPYENRAALEQTGGARQLLNFLENCGTDDNRFMALQLVLTLVTYECLASSFAKEGISSTLFVVADQTVHENDYKPICLQILEHVPKLCIMNK
jgi:hypothetical protein